MRSSSPCIFLLENPWGKQPKLLDVIAENQLLKSTTKRLEEECQRLRKRVTELKEQLLNRTNTQSLSTPSSKLFPKSNRPPNGSRPRGAPKGHRGASLEIPDHVDDECIHSPTTCPICGNDQLGEESEGWSQTVFDIQPAPIVVIRHVYKRRWCPECKKKVSSPPSDTLPHRNYGPNLATLVGYFVTLGIPLPKIQLIFETLFGRKISIPTIMDLANLLGKSIEPEYQNLRSEVKNASPVYGDETGFRIDGINNWCWGFVWNDGIVYEIHRSRGKTVPLNVLGEDFQGLLGRDGWSAYNAVGGLHQLCYIHVNRNIARVEVKRGVEERGFLEPTPVKFRKKGRPPNRLKEFLVFAEKLRTIMRDAVRFTEREPSPSLEERCQISDRLLRRLDGLTSKYWSDEDTVRLCKHVRTFRDSFFTFVTHPEIRWENNTAERGMRKIANIRNNSGGRRSRKGADTLQALLSVFETWRMRRLDVFTEAKTVLLREAQKPFNDDIVA